jgi:hypothetical protein
MFSGDQKLDLRNVCDFLGGAYRFEFIRKAPESPSNNILVDNQGLS